MIKSEKKLVLASGSPRRKELLATIYPQFEVCSADTDEDLPLGILPCNGVKMLAERKARCIYDLFVRKDKNIVVLGADTVVAYEECILGKPKDEADAVKTLRFLSGKTHTVYTGVCVMDKNGVRTDVACSYVTFRNLSDGQIAEYVAGGSPMDKAGAYGIQDGVAVEGFSGSYSNIVGLPLELTEKMLKEVMETC